VEAIGASNRQGAAGIGISGEGDWLATAYSTGSRPYVPTSAGGGHLRAQRSFCSSQPSRKVCPPRAPWRRLARCSFTHDDKCFYPESADLGPIADLIGLLSTARRLVVTGSEREGDTTIFLLAGAMAAIVSDKALRAAWADGPRRRREGLEALPDFIALPRDEVGRPIIPQSRVTALVEARDAWASELGTFDAVTRSIMRGQLVMPQISAPSQQRPCATIRRGRTTRTRSALLARSL
jgi:hypothetical protein